LQGDATCQQDLAESPSDEQIKYIATAIRPEMKGSAYILPQA